VLALLALVTLGLKLLAERHMSAELSAARDVPAYAGPVTPPANATHATHATHATRATQTTHASQQHPLKQGEL
jgi:sulfate transport system permease protein